MNNLFNPQLSKFLIIGTKSKSRKKLFKALNLNFNYKSANINEKNVPNLKNNKFDALKIATAKAMHLSSKYKNKVIILSAIDNLIKGGAGQAVQNLNIKFNFPEKTAL